MIATSSVVGLAVNSCQFHVTIEVNATWVTYIPLLFAIDELGKHKLNDESSINLKVGLMMKPSILNN